MATPGIWVFQQVSPVHTRLSYSIAADRTNCIKIKERQPFPHPVFVSIYNNVSLQESLVDVFRKFLSVRKAALFNKHVSEGAWH